MAGTRVTFDNVKLAVGTGHAGWVTFLDGRGLVVSNLVPTGRLTYSGTYAALKNVGGVPGLSMTAPTACVPIEHGFTTTLRLTSQTQQLVKAVFTVDPGLGGTSSATVTKAPFSLRCPGSLGDDAVTPASSERVTYRVKTASQSVQTKHALPQVPFTIC